MKRPRILFAAQTAPYPLNSGTKIRIHHLARGLSQIGDVDLVTYAWPHDFSLFPQERADCPGWWSTLRSLQLVPGAVWKESDPTVYRSRVRWRLLRRDSLLYKSFPIGPLRRRLDPLAATADLIWVARLFTATGLAEHASKMIVDLDDLESAKTGRQVAIEPSPYMRWAFRREAARLARDECSAVRKFARVAVCSPADAAVLGQSHPDRIWVLPNGVDDALFDFPQIARISRRLVFIGTMLYEPNQDAIHYFCREILPLIRAQLSDVTFDIVGLMPPGSILSLHDGRNVFVHPNVPSVVPFVQRAALSIVPLRVGGGTRLKILESLALATPVVSTTVGAEGLGFLTGQHLLLADTPAAFAGAVIRLLREPDYAEEITAAGRRRTSELYRWSKIRDHAATLVDDWLAVRWQQNAAKRKSS